MADKDKKNNKDVEKFMSILSCPVCKGDLHYSDDHKFLVCSKCGQEYEIKDGIPILIPDFEKSD
ncbi:MAG: Trm112 family protein [Candidatus Woesearchaeota archaeon]